MFRKLCLALVVLAFPLATASAVAAQDPQYPPTGELETEVQRDPADPADPADPGDPADPADPGDTAGAPLARTGSDTGTLVVVGGVLVAAGAVAAGAGAAARRRTA